MWQVTADGSAHRYSANFRPASTDALDINKPIGIPGAADWPSGQADQYYFVTVRALRGGPSEHCMLHWVVAFIFIAEAEVHASGVDRPAFLLHLSCCRRTCVRKLPLAS